MTKLSKTQRLYAKHAEEIRKIYKKDDICTYQLLDAWDYYLETLPDCFKWSKWQYDYCDHFLIYREVLNNFVRGGGKTEKGSLLMVFLAIIGYQCLWYSGARNQLIQLQRNLVLNPYVQTFKPDEKRKRATLVNDSQLDFMILSDDNAIAVRVEALFFDEVARMDEVDLGTALGTDTHYWNPFTMFTSTPRKGTIFETLCKQKPHNVIHKTYLQCAWMNHKRIEGKHIKNGGIMADWQWRQEFMAEFIIPGGSVFGHNIIEMDYKKYILQFQDYHKSQGIDPGGGTVGHSSVRIAIVNEFIYICAEENWQYKLDDELLQAWCDKYPTEIESGGWNDIYAPTFTGVSDLSFAEKKDIKAKLINETLKYQIVIDPEKFPKLYHDLVNAEFDDKGRVDTHKLHFLAALLHAQNINPKSVPFDRFKTTEEKDFQELMNEYING